MVTIEREPTSSVGADGPANEAGWLDSTDPATGELVGRVGLTQPEDVERIASEAAAAQVAWARRPLADRARIVARAARIFLDRSDELATLVSRETGKTLMDATAVDVGAGSMVLDWIGRNATKHLAPERIATPQIVLRHKRHTIHYSPLGVIGVIAPWNYPLLVPVGPLGMALVAGNAVVFKPSELTPLVGQRLAEVFVEAGVPTGVLRVAQGAGDIGAAICAAPSIAKICFTGGVPTGMKVRQLAGEHGKPVILELGGKDPAIVCHDADLDRAVAGTLWAATAGAGQTCVAVERVYVDRRVYDAYLAKLTVAIDAVTLGHPRDPRTQLGPLINEAQFERVMAQVDDARSKGATVRGGAVEVEGLSGRFIEPTLLTDVDHTMTVMQEETFGPLIPVMPFDTEAEAIRLANDSSYGLGASVWSRSPSRARRIADRLEAGMVWVNDHGSSAAAAQAPWAGVKSSGLGVIHSRFGFYEMVDKRLISEDRGWLPVPWWYPYDEAGRRGFIALLQTVTAPGLRGRIRTGWSSRRTLGSFARKLLRAVR